MIKLINKNLTSSNFFIFLLIGYIFFLPIQIKFVKNEFFHKFQISEFFFIILVIITFKKTIINFLKYFNNSDYIIIGLSISGLISYLFASKYLYSSADLFVILYLFFFYFFVKLNLKSEHIIIIINSLIFSCLFTSIFGLFGYLLLYFNYPTNLLFYISDYPYLGDIYRIKSYMYSPSMFNSFICLGLLLHLSKIIFTKKELKIFDGIIILIFLSAIFLSFTKSMICIFWSCIFLIIINFSINKIYKFFILFFFTFFFTILYITVSHFIFKINVESITEPNIFTSSYILYSFNFLENKIDIFPTNYYYLKISAIRAFNESPMLGIGIGNFNDFLESLRQLNLYPSSFPNWDPHSTLFGAASEQGLFGLIVTLIFLIYAVIKNYKKQNHKYAFVQNALLVYFIYIFIDSICLDVMNFRFVWIAFILSIFLSKKEIKSSSI